MNEIGFERFRIQLIINYPCEEIIKLKLKNIEKIIKIKLKNMKKNIMKIIKLKLKNIEKIIR